jgi:hypothetical protein
LAFVVWVFFFSCCCFFELFIRVFISPLLLFLRGAGCLDIAWSFYFWSLGANRTSAVSSSCTASPADLGPGWLAAGWLVGWLLIGWLAEG